MSIAVGLDGLADAIAARSGPAYLVTVRDQRPHVVEVAPRLVSGVLVVGAGRRTGRNIVDNPAVTFLWPTDERDPKHSLLVDGTAALAEGGEEILVTPVSAILHRARPQR